MRIPVLSTNSSLLCLCLASISALGMPHAHAQESTPEVVDAPAAQSAPASGARELVVRAVGEYNAGRYEEAYALFLRAHRLEPTARTLRSMGMVLFELRRYVDAAQRLSQALVETRRALTDRQREQTRVLLERARQFVARVVVHVSPADAILTLDGAPVELMDGELDLDAGTYTLVAQCEGCQSQSARIRALPGERREITLTLAELSETSVDAPRALPEAPPSLTLPALTLGAGLGMVLAAVPTALLARAAQDKLAERCPRGVCDGSLRATRDRATRFALITDVLWISGALVSAAGLAWLLGRRGSRPSVDVGVACGPDGCVSQLVGRF
ncbi:MAG: tetratricopeptide repeat protein [Deltaproteobacteria bacterium]|nr:tetratricopeptide repeat protein [Deltaproteobacteria bacterium]